MTVRDKAKMPIFSEKAACPGRYGHIPTRDQRILDGFLLREDCPCPAVDCPHKGNCLACIMFHYMMSVRTKTRMVIPSCAYFSERDYWMEQRKKTDSPEVKAIIEEWLAYYRDKYNIRRDMNKDTMLVAWEQEFENQVISKFCEEYGGKTPGQREERIAKNKRKGKSIPGTYPYR